MYRDHSSNNDGNHTDNKKTDLQLLVFVPPESQQHENQQSPVALTNHSSSIAFTRYTVFKNLSGHVDNGFDWFVRCPSSVYVHPDRLRDYLDRYHSGNANAVSIPVYLGFNDTVDPDKAATYCRVWNAEAARRIQSFELDPTTTDAVCNHPKVNDYSDPTYFEKCFLRREPTPRGLVNVSFGLLPVPPSRSATPCGLGPSNLSKDQWMFPELFQANFMRASISHWLALTSPERFMPKNRCSCTHNKIAHRIDLCGHSNFYKNKNSRKQCYRTLKGCPVLNRNNTNTTETSHLAWPSLPTSNIPTYVISIFPNATQERIDRYVPQPVLDGRLLHGVWIRGDGINAYRQSMAKALGAGLETGAKVLAVLDEDFRVSKTFSKQWAELVASDSCYTDTLANDGVFLLGSTVWDEKFWVDTTAYPQDYLRGGVGGGNNNSNSSKRINSTGDPICFDGMQSTRGSYASLFSRKAAAVALDWIEATPPTRAFDMLWMDLIGLGFPVRAALRPLIVPDVEHNSTVSDGRAANARYADPVFRHGRHRWGPVDAYVPASGDLSDGHSAAV